jgi:hypothetical protein
MGAENLVHAGIRSSDLGEFYYTFHVISVALLVFLVRNTLKMITE